jgi:hypothetical protein
VSLLGEPRGSDRLKPHVGFTRHILEHLINFDQLIKFAVEQNASDLHFQTGAAPLLRINGQMRNVESPPLTNEVMRQFILSLRPKMTADELDLQLVQGLDFSYYVPGLSRFRVNVYSHLGAPAMVLRVIKPKIRTMEELQLPPVIKDIALSHRGLTLVTGTTGSGKSTTLAAMIDLINKLLPLQDHHDRGSGRVHAYQPEGPDLSGRGRAGHVDVRERAASGLAAGSRRDLCGRVA